MSLLEDVFLEDEAGEAQELERIIEGDEYGEEPRPSTPNSNENSEKEDEAEEDKRHVDPASAKPKRAIKNPRVVLNPVRLTGPRGIQLIPEHFKDFTFKGKGHEKEDLDLVLKKLEHWAYRLYPKFGFKDCLKKIETLGNKRPVVVHLTKIRNDQLVLEETVVQRESSGDEAAPEQEEDEFDKLLRQQIELARATPAPGTAKKGFSTPVVENSQSMPIAILSPSINEEQREKMLRNRRIAEERRLARLKLNNSETGHQNGMNDTETNDRHGNSTNDMIEKDSRHDNIFKDDRNDNTIEKSAPNTVTIVKESTNSKDLIQDSEESINGAKHNRSNIIYSSDSEDDNLVINESVNVDVHNHRNYDGDEPSDIGHVNENNTGENSDIVQQNANDKELNSDIRQNGNEQDSNIDHRNQNKQGYSELDRENENYSRHDTDPQEIIQEIVQEIRIESKDVEMNVVNVTESINTNSKEMADFNELDANIENSDIENGSKNKTEAGLNQIQPNDEFNVVSNKHDTSKKMEQDTENTEEARKDDKIAIADIDDIMDVDFSDDF